MQKRNDNSRITYLQITTKCNARCLMCDIWNQDSYDMDISIINKLLDNIEKSFPGSEIRLTGGEPCVHKNFIQIVEEIRNRNLTLSIITNGTLFNFDNFNTFNFDRIFFSLDSPFAEDQNQIRGINLSLNQKYDIDLIANIIISKLNKNILCQIADWLNRNDVRKVNIIPMKDEKYALKFEEFIFYSKEFLKECNRLGISHFVEGNRIGVDANNTIQILSNNISHKVCNIQEIVKFYTIDNKSFNCNSMSHRTIPTEQIKRIKCIDCHVYNENKCDLSNMIYNELHYVR